MKHLLSKIEPLLWFMFGQGIMIGTILLTGWVLVVGVGIPTGLFSADALDYERAHMLASNIIGRVILLGLIALPMWKGAHHLRHLSLDFGGAERDGLVGGVLYGLATVGSVLAVLAIIRL
jgi:fumarate reductase subunit D